MGGSAIPEMMHCPRCNWIEPLETWSQRAKEDECPRCGEAGMELASQEVVVKMGVAWCRACNKYHSS